MPSLDAREGHDTQRIRIFMCSTNYCLAIVKVFQNSIDEIIEAFRARDGTHIFL